MAKLEQIEGIGPKFAAKLREAGVGSIEALLKMGASRKGREMLVEKSGIDHKLILEWVNLADLFRIRGVGEEFSDLLEETGVDTVAELARRNAENLYKAMVEKNEAAKLVRRLPTQQQVAGWVEEAKTLPRMVEY